MNSFRMPATCLSLCFRKVSGLNLLGRVVPGAFTRGSGAVYRCTSISNASESAIMAALSPQPARNRTHAVHCPYVLLSCFVITASLLPARHQQFAPFQTSLLPDKYVPTEHAHTPLLRECSVQPVLLSSLSNASTYNMHPERFRAYWRQVQKTRNFCIQTRSGAMPITGR
jgi:hypothetical protein